MGLPSPRVVAVTAIAVARVAWAADATCPAPTAIAAELARLPGSGALALALLARSEVTAQGRTLRIVLRDDAGHVLGVREIEAPHDCLQRAAVAAVVLAAWSHTWDGPAVTVAPTAAAAPRRWAELGMQAGVHRDGTGMAPGATVLAGLQLAGPLSAGVIAGFIAARQQDLGPGAVGYSLARAGAGLVYRAHPGATWLDAGLFPLIVRLGVTPRNLPAARAVALWAGALEARFRLGLTWRRLMPFVCGSVGRRFVRDRVTLEDVPESAEISPWDFNVGVGLAVLLGGENG